MTQKPKDKSILTNSCWMNFFPTKNVILMTAEMAEGLKIKGGGVGSKDETGFASISGKIWGEQLPPCLFASAGPAWWSVSLNTSLESIHYILFLTPILKLCHQSLGKENLERRMNDFYKFFLNVWKIRRNWLLCISHIYFMKQWS